MVMPPREHEALKHELFGDNGKGIDSLYDALARTKVQNAKAYSACDRAAMLIAVENKPGYKPLSIQVNRLLRRWAVASCPS